MTHLVAVYIRQVVAGFALSALFVALLIGLDVAGLGHLVTHVDAGWLAVLMLWVFNGIVFAGVQFALALPSGSDDRSGGKRAFVPLAEPIPVRVDRHPPRR